MKKKTPDVMRCKRFDDCDMARYGACTHGHKHTQNVACEQACRLIGGKQGATCKVLKPLTEAEQHAMAQLLNVKRVLYDLINVTDHELLPYNDRKDIK